MRLRWLHPSWQALPNHLSKPDCIADFAPPTLAGMKLNSLLWPCLLLLGWMLPILATDKPPKVKEAPKEVEFFRAPNHP